MAAASRVACCPGRRRAIARSASGTPQAVVAIEMPDAPLIQEKGGGLPHVMKKGGKSESGGGGDQGSRLDAVGIHVPAVVGITLVKAHRRAQLWKNLGSLRRGSPQHLAPLRGSRVAGEIQRKYVPKPPWTAGERGRGWAAAVSGWMVKRSLTGQPESPGGAAASSSIRRSGSPTQRISERSDPLDRQTGRSVPPDPRPWR